MKIKYVLDADLPRALFSGLMRRLPHLDVVRVLQVGLTSAADPAVLAYAASEDRIVVSRDKATMFQFAVDRIDRGEAMPGLLLVRPTFVRRRGRGLRIVVEELILIAECSEAEEWHHVIQYIPFLTDA